jgi:hypothetical protein
VSNRDYSRFLRDGGKLNVRLLPRPVYTQLVNEYRTQPTVIQEVFEAQFWLWDLEEAERKAAAEGRDASRADLAQQVLNGMDDNDWWKCMSAFEEHLIDHFHESPERWADILDPIYDEQELAGWIPRQ